VNPHDICGWVGRHAGRGLQRDVPDTDLPPLPDNFEIEDLAQRPLPIQYLCCSHRRLAQASSWGPSSYRRYLNAYRSYLEQADAEVGRLLDARLESAAGRETIVVLLSDHGDGLAAHRHVTKHAAFYEEAVRVPLIVAGPGLPQGRRVDEPLVSTLDVFPTLCDLAAVPVPPDLRGRSLAAWLGKDVAAADGTDYVVSEWHTEYGDLVTPGRMLRTRRYKYVRYLDDGGEELYDLEADPGERRTVIADPAHGSALRAHRELLQRHLLETGDPFLRLAVKVDRRWRTHPAGYRNHRGPSSLDEARKRPD
jgi:choline-sulfatase